MSFIGKFISSITNLPQEILGQGAAHEAKRQDRAKQSREAIDVAHRAMRAEAARKNEELGGLVKLGTPVMRREKAKKQVRQKVWNVISRNFNVNDPEMVDEITEKLVDAAEVDARYASMLDLDQEK